VLLRAGAGVAGRSGEVLASRAFGNRAATVRILRRIGSSLQLTAKTTDEAETINAANELQAMRNVGDSPATYHAVMFRPAAPKPAPAEKQH